jgi:formate dehydrogenase major subunit
MVDIKNADVVLIMGGNAAEAHPCGFKWVTEAKPNKAPADRRRSALHALGLGGRPLCAHPHRHRHRLPGRGDQLPARQRQDPARLRALHRHELHREGRLRLQDGLFSGYDADKRSYDKPSWDYETGEDGYVKTDPTLSIRAASGTC